MAAYIIAEVEVTGPDTYATYRAQTPGVVARTAAASSSGRLVLVEGVQGDP